MSTGRSEGAGAAAPGPAGVAATAGTTPAAWGREPRIGVVVASVGRAADVAMLLEALARQTRRPDRVVLAVADRRDAPPPSGLDLPVEVVLSERGASTQRNRGIAAAAAAGCDLMMFFDDDFLPAADYLEQVAAAMRAEPTLLAVDGRVVADGAVGPGLDWQTAGDILGATVPEPAALRYDQPGGLYGCNMCVRMAALGPSPFDESLPLYAWLEDWDLSRRLSRQGRIGRVMQARGVHLGVKRGRTSGLRMGYSQIANPVYLLRKGTMPLGTVAHHLLRRTAGNVWGALRRDPYVDRPGRLRGNLLGLRDMALGRLHPTRILGL